jgi:hypothetical protein
MNGSGAEPEIRINAPAALAPVIGAFATLGPAALATVASARGGVADEYLSGGHRGG